MHRLHRAEPAPTCLANYRDSEHTWDDVTSADKGLLRDALREMQGTLCAYCEGDIRPHNDGKRRCHIEHFRRKSDHRKLTFEWSNLFLSCDGLPPGPNGQPGHCGHYKDRRGAPSYAPADIIKPDEEDPDESLYFHRNGEARARSGKDAPDPGRAEVTIRVLGLNEGALRALRRGALVVYQEGNQGNRPILEELMEVADEGFRREFIEAEIEATRRDPYSTVIRHFLQGRA